AIPHVQRLAAFSRIAPSRDRDVISHLSTFRLAGQSDPLVLVVVDGAAYVTRLDGSRASKIDLPYRCEAPGVSADGIWLACPNETDQSHDAPELQVALLVPNSLPLAHITRLARGGFYLYPTWSPDGKMLAIVHDRDNTGEGCAIRLYRSAPPYEQF